MSEKRDRQQVDLKKYGLRPGLEEIQRSSHPGYRNMSLTALIAAAIEVGVKQIRAELVSGGYLTEKSDDSNLHPDQAMALEVLRRFSAGETLTAGELSIAARGLGVSTQALIDLADSLGLKKGNGNHTEVRR
jgi:hypothetical protein